MSELPELEARIAAALARIEAGLAGLDARPEPQQPPQEAAPPQDLSDGSQDAVLAAQQAAEEAAATVAELTVKLDEEQTANAQLEERVKLLKARQDGKLSELEASVDAARARAARMDRELQRLRQTNSELRDINAQLRTAVAKGVSEPHLVNKAMMAELDALRATRAADAAEMDAILDELTPIIEKETGNATS